ncbi:VTT domain-containing protein [Candidatus Nitrospira bockiana]
MIHPCPIDTRRLLEPGRNCWRIERAARVAFLIDGEQYFTAFRRAAAKAERAIMILGWDFDTRVRLCEDTQAEGLPTVLGDFLKALLRRRRDLHVYVLPWDYHMIYAFEREWWPLSKIGPDRRLHFKMDGTHPPGASHHQKVVVVDDQLAFVGGFDLAQCRWDTSEHRPHHPLRVFPDGKPCRPFHDVMVMLEGPVAGALGTLVRERWRAATGRHIASLPPMPLGRCWPEAYRPDLHDVDVAIARTQPRYLDRPEIREVERLYLDALQAARRHVYIETQYLTSQAIVDTLVSRLQEPQGPEILIVLHPNSDGWLEQHTMDVLRGRLLKRLRAADRSHRLGLYYPHVPEYSGECMSVHSKVLIVDDDLVRVGSANLSNRSMGFDTECDVAVEAQGDPRVREGIVQFRSRLLGEHVGTSPQTVRETVRREGSLLKAVERLRSDGRSLRIFDSQIPPEVDSWVPDAVLIDPDRPLDPEILVDQMVPPPHRKPARRQIVIGASLLLALVGLAAAWHWTPLRAWLDIPKMVEYVSTFQDSRIAPIVAIGGFVVGGLAVVPVTFLIAVSVLAFGPLAGFTYAFAGMTLSALLTFGLGHLLGQQTVQKLSGSRLHKLSQRLGQRGVLAVVAVRVIPVAPFTIVNLVAGASHIRFRDFLIGTVIGELPGLLGISIFMDQVAAAVRDPGPGSFLLLAVIVLVLAGGAVLLRRWLRGKAP